MSACPYCDWRYDAFSEPWAVYLMGAPFPVVFDGTLRSARGSEAPNGRLMATGWHICTEHTFEPEVLLLGPWEERLYGSRPYWNRRTGYAVN